MSLSQILSGATAVGILIALGVLAVTVGLIRSDTTSEPAHSHRYRAGAPTRRNRAAVTAGALGLLGALTGTAIAYLAAISWFRHAAVIVSTAPARSPRSLTGRPLSAATGGWLFAGRQPGVIARQPLE